MRRNTLALLFAALAGGGLATASAASAMPLSGPQLAQRIINGEFRGYTNTMRGFENHIWHFLPDGRVRVVADSQRMLRRENYRQEWQDIGVWRLEGDRVCVSFQGPNQTVSGCYVVEAGWRRQVRMVGPYVWQGTLEAHD